MIRASGNRSLKDSRKRITKATGFEDGEAGLEAARSQPFDAIVLDIMLPKRTGLEMLRELRAGGIRTPVILVTALGTVEERVVGLQAGADDYLVKPFAFVEPGCTAGRRVPSHCRPAARRGADRRADARSGGSARHPRRQ